jgi:hypothetical protein
VDAIKFIRDYSRVGHQMEQLGYNVPPLLGVIQGSTMEDALQTFMLYYTLPLVDYISVPRIITKQHGSRMPLLMEMHRVMGITRSFKGLHLLGFSDNILDDVACARLPFIKGIDSAVPIRAALKGMRMSEAMDDGEWSMNVGPRGDFWEQPCNDHWNRSLPLTRDNLELYRSWIARSAKAQSGLSVEVA